MLEMRAAAMLGALLGALLALTVNWSGRCPDERERDPAYVDGYARSSRS